MHIAVFLWPRTGATACLIRELRVVGGRIGGVGSGGIGGLRRVSRSLTFAFAFRGDGSQLPGDLPRDRFRYSPYDCFRVY